MFQDFQLQAGLKTYPGGLPLFKPRVWVEPQTSFNTFQDSFVTLFGLMVRACCARWPPKMLRTCARCVQHNHGRGLFSTARLLWPLHGHSQVKSELNVLMRQVMSINPKIGGQPVEGNTQQFALFNIFFLFIAAVFMSQAAPYCVCVCVHVQSAPPRFLAFWCRGHLWGTLAQL
jgi:hypothetical protein